MMMEELWGEETRRLLASIEFADRRAIHHRLQRMADDAQTRSALADCLPELLLALADAAHPDQALVNLERFTHNVPDRPAFFRFLATHPRAIEMLVKLFSSSQFLTEILLRHPQYFERLTQPRRLAQPKTARQFSEEAQAVVASFTAEDGKQVALSALDALRRFQRWELLRIGVCDLLDLLDLPTVTLQLSNLADSLVDTCLHLASAQTGIPTDGFAVLGLGKLGGQELNYSSDIDLLFIAASDASAFQRLGERLIHALSHVTAEGFLYRVDMRLRPWGSIGPLVSSLDGHIVYLQNHARLWERQALLKARVIAGDRSVGEEFLCRAKPFVFGAAKEAVRADVHAMKQRTEAYLRERGREWGEVKLGQGSIRDVEFVTQFLQLAHGAEHPEVRSPNTLEALTRLFTHRFISADEYRVLADGYVFLRTIEHYLQLMHHQQVHTLPKDGREIAYLARRLGFRGSDAGAQFLARYEQHCRAIRAVYQRYLEEEPLQSPTTARKSTSSLQSHIERMDPSYTAVFSAEEIERHAMLAERLDAENIVEVDAVPLDDDRWRVTIVGYDYLGELSLICGLLFVYGFNILDGHIFTYEPTADRRPPTAVQRPVSAIRRRRSYADARRKIVDVFTVRPVHGSASAEVWSRYAEDLTALLRRLQAGEQREAQGELAKRVAEVLRKIGSATTTLYPVDIEIDNEVSERYTVLRIEAPDTIGFLYEFTNALALYGIYIARVTVESVGNRVHDTLYVTDAYGRKITAPEKQRELRAATVLVKHFTHLLPLSPNPESALMHFREFLGQLFMRPDWPDELASLEDPKVLRALARLLGVSDFLWNDFLRMQYDNLFPVVRDVDTLAMRKLKEELQTELEAELQEASDEEARRDVLNAFKDREMFRIDMRHILGHFREFGQFSAELTELAEVVVDAAYRLCEEALRAQFGTPCKEDGTPSPISVCALGKFGGYELGFASDIELMFVYAANGETTGPEVITTTEFYEKLVQAFMRTIRSKREGIFEIDLQLRPYGRAGTLAVSLEAFRQYFAPDGPAWPYERQALVKLRPVAGDLAFGAEIAALRDELIYTGEPFDVAAMRAMRERQLRHLVTPGTINAKFSPGGLVDVEYLVQGLQITHGHRDPRLRKTNTREAIHALAEAGILAAGDYERLLDALNFLRQLINALRMVRGHAKDLTVPPTDSEEFAFLARRLGYGSQLERLREDLTRHMSDVQELSTRLLLYENPTAIRAMHECGRPTADDFHP